MVLTIPEGVHYRAEAVRAGGEALKYTVTREIPSRWHRSDVLVCWNLHRNQAARADECRAAGGRVLVMENGYYGRDENGHQLYAIARDGHNGSGWIAWDTYPRGAAVKLNYLRWVDQARIPCHPLDYHRRGYTLIIGQRGIGSALMRSPSNWHHAVGVPFARKGWPQDSVRIREHPGQDAPLVSLAEDLAGAARVVQWSSACGVAALQAGVPVYFGAPHWVAELGAHRIHDPLALITERSPEAQLLALAKVAASQWSLAEISAGEPFRRLLSD